MLTCIAVDDEPLALNVIQNHVNKIEGLDLRKSFINPLEALEYLSYNSVDLVLLDIHMPDLDGLALSKLIKGGSQIVFTTAYSEYAVQGFEVAATDYLLKPISFERFLEMFERTRSRVRNLNSEKDLLFLKDGSQWLKVELKNLLFLKADDNYVVFQEKTGKTLVRITLTEAMEQIKTGNFMKVHRSYIVNFDEVQKIEKHQVHLAQYKIPVSQSYRTKLLKRMGLE